MEKFPNSGVRGPSGDMGYEDVAHIANSENSQYTHNRTTDRGRGQKSMSALFESDLNAYNHIVNTYPSEIENKMSDFIERRYGELNSNDREENLKLINSLENGSRKNLAIAEAIFYPDRLKASHPEIISKNDVHKILLTGYKIESQSEFDEEYNHDFIAIASSGEVSAGASPEEAKNRHLEWDQDKIFLTLSRGKSPLSEVDKDTIIQMIEERSEEYMAGDYPSWFEYPMRSQKTDNYFEDDMRTLARIFNGDSPRTALHKDIMKIFKYADGESILMDKGWDGYNFSEIIDRTMLNLNDFSDAVSYMKHKVDLIQDLEKRTRYYKIYRRAVQSGKEALGLR